MRERFWSMLFIVVVLFVGFNAGYLLGQSPLAPYNAFAGGSLANRDADTIRPFWETWDLVHDRYYSQPIDDKLLVEGAIEGMLATLGDRNTRYLAPSEEVHSQEEMDGEFQGIGVVVEDIEGAITVVSPIEGSPAEAAGLRPGDIFLEADGTDLAGLDLSEAADLIRGLAGTPVNLLVQREGETFAIDIIRDVISTPSVRGEMLDDNIAYIRISQFIRTTDVDLEEVLEELVVQNPAGMILDLRRNPGGLLDQVTVVADEFLPEGTVLVEEFAGGRQRVYETSADGQAEDIPLVVLIDEGSASASEVLAGAIQELDRGILIGNNSFGKGTIQSLHVLSNGGGLRLTIARWLTPGENWVHETGLEPDFEVALPDDVVFNDDTDPQLQAAIDYLLGRSLPAKQATDD